VIKSSSNSITGLDRPWRQKVQAIPLQAWTGPGDKKFKQSHYRPGQALEIKSSSNPFIGLDRPWR